MLAAGDDRLMIDATTSEEPWRSLSEMWVQVVSPRFGWVWAQNAMHHDYQRWVRLPTGTRFLPPRRVVHGPPVGAYVCEPVPTDGSDAEPWLAFEMVHGFAPLEPGAVVEMRPPETRLLAPSRLKQREEQWVWEPE